MRYSGTVTHARAHHTGRVDQTNPARTGAEPAWGECLGAPQNPHRPEAQPGKAKRARTYTAETHAWAVGRGNCRQCTHDQQQQPGTPKHQITLGGGPNMRTPDPDELEPEPEPEGAALEPEVRSQAARVKAVHGTPGGEQWGWSI